MEASAQQEAAKVVIVVLTVTSEDGETRTTETSIAGGPTRVAALKEELGIPVDSSLWVIDKAGKKKPLGDHETHNVKEGDRYEALVKGGVS